MKKENSLKKRLKKAKLILENGSIYEGYSFAADSCVNGEVVFNTGMVGYPQSLTDPSYCGQILCFTYPLIGNYGVQKKKEVNGLLAGFESDRIQVQGMIVADYSFEYAHWNAAKSLQDWLKEEKIPAITGIDTRALTKELREKGTMLGKIVIEGKEQEVEALEIGRKEKKGKVLEIEGKEVEGEKLEFDDPNKRNLVKEVSVKKPVEYKAKNEKYRIVLVDCGAKNNIIRSLLKRNASVLRVPWNYDVFANGIEFDALLFSNGPGDPKMAKETIEIARKSIESNTPSFGICLGTQIMALAVGADTYKLKYGHRSQNQPCRMNGTSKAFITSQNHGFAVKKDSLPADWKEWFVNLNDGTVEGVKHEKKPFMAVQFHPEAAPGPKDTEFLFEEFLKQVKKQ